MGDDSLPGLVAELYALPPEDFVAARDEAARRAKVGGDRAVAATIGKLRRPTVGAWLVNLLAHERPDLVEELLELAEELRTAQRNLRGDELRELSARRRQMVPELARTAVDLARGHHRRNNLPVAEVEATLSAAMAEPEVAEQVRAGALTKAVSYAGFGETPRPRLRLLQGGGDPAADGAVAGPEVADEAVAHPEAAADSEADGRDAGGSDPGLARIAEHLRAQSRSKAPARGADVDVGQSTPEPGPGTQVDRPTSIKGRGRERAERDRAEHERAERDRAEHERAEHERAEHERAEHERAAPTQQAGKGQAGKGQAGKGQAGKGQAGKGQAALRPAGQRRVVEEAAAQKQAAQRRVAEEEAARRRAEQGRVAEEEAAQERAVQEAIQRVAQETIDEALRARAREEQARLRRARAHAHRELHAARTELAEAQAARTAAERAVTAARRRVERAEAAVNSFESDPGTET